MDCGALDELEDRITSLTAAALAALHHAPIDARARDELRQLAAYVSHREI